MSEAYKRAGVDIDAGNRAVERMKKHVQRTFRPEVLTDLGGFGALFRLDAGRYRDPVLVSGTDGVGTKLKIAFALDRHDTIGIDAVAMCVNDIVVQGAEPLFFLDYLACGRLVPEKIEAIVKGIADGCAEAGCALIGGETAEMPGMYGEEEYDLAGFCVGIVEREKLVDGRSIREGDAVLGLGSNGLHSNGFSLVRKVLLEEAGMSLEAELPVLGKRLGEELLTPTRIYVKPVLAVLDNYPLKGLAHITGGGFYENIPRVLPDGLDVEIEEGSWPVPPVFQLIAEYGNISRDELYRTFNMGIGMIVIVDKDHAEDVREEFRRLGEEAYLIGRVVKGEGRVRIGGGGA
ncbi:phosphoribosylformylglycinamidine cyclo-ligase [Bacillaceae bacterium]